MNWERLTKDNAPLGTAIKLFPPFSTPNTDIDALLLGLPKPQIKFLQGVADNSTHLRALILRDRDWVDAMMSSSLDDFLTVATQALMDDMALADSEAPAMAALRRYKAKTALSIALWDIADATDKQIILTALTKAADISVEVALKYLIKQEVASGKCTFEPTDDTLVGLGFVLLGMGKQGGFELNYSSDIDVIALYDPQAPVLADGQEPSVFWVRLVKRLVRLLQERTGDGYVYRTDLRLRPDPASTPLAVSLPGALQYYESLGQNWERAAFIKARPVSGDLAFGDDFLKEISPFIWRKYLDYAAIEDVHSIKRQIHAHKGFGHICSAGHNIKLGRGGIREIEFFVQTQQLIAGGRNVELRLRETLAGLNELTKMGWVTEEARVDLTKAYWFLRQVENRIQMLDDEQTHIIPENEEKRQKLANLSGIPDLAEFDRALIETFTTVQRHYADLFEEAESLAAETGNLVFTGDEDDPATIETLTGLGFQQPASAIATIRGWHFGRFAATRSSHARSVLTQLVPIMLKQFSLSGQPDQALSGFDRFVAGLPAGLQLFSLLKTNPDLLKLLSIILGAAPRLAATITRRPHILDALLDRAFFETSFKMDDFSNGLCATLKLATGFEDSLDRARIFTQEQKFLIGVRLLTGTLKADEAARAYTELAETVVVEMLAVTRKDFEQKHGCVPGSDIAILGMGKLGSHEMTSSSDLDLILIYDVEDPTSQSDGKRQLPASQYFIRLTQRLIAALSAPTGEGLLYEIDMRLRPSGNAGPVATQYQTFVSYQLDQAWTWERMALTRARSLRGGNALAQKLTDTIRDILGGPAPENLTADAREMLGRIMEAKPSKHVWDVKTARGGIVEIEFIAQVLQLKHGQSLPSILVANTEAVLRAAGDAKVLSGSDMDTLIEAEDVYSSLQQLTRMAFDSGEAGGDFLSQTGFMPILLGAFSLPDIDVAEAYLKELSERVASITQKQLA